MKKLEIFKKFIPALVLFAALLASFPRVSNFPYQYKKGNAWKYETLVSQYDFPILKTEEQMMREKYDSRHTTIPYYRFSQEIADKNLKDLALLDLRELEPYRNVITSSMTDIYEKGILNDHGVRVDSQSQRDSATLMYIQKDKRALKYPVSEIYKLSDAKTRLLKDVAQVCSNPSLDSLLKSTDTYSLILPNLVFDPQTTELVSGEENQDLSPTLGYIANGQTIVSKGEIVTSDIAQILDSYKAEYNVSVGYSRHRIFLWLADVLMAFLLVVLFHVSVFFIDSKLLKNLNTYLCILSIYAIVAITALIVISAGAQNYLFLLPFTVAALWLRAFFNRSVSFAIYAQSLLPMLIFAHSGLALFVLFLVGGGVSIYYYDRMSRGWKQFLMSVLVFGAMAVTYSALRLLDIATGNSLMNLLFIWFSALLSVAFYPLVYLFERLFNLVSYYRLSELADTSNKLLRELEQKAPGTFQHSLQVANMVDASARAIGADPLLLRVGALYHDIGKMNNPQCFIENESLLNKDTDSKYHGQIDPMQSAQDIVHHVTDGIEIAEHNHIPAIVREFIITHHGTSTVSYFFNKFLNDGGDPSEENVFKYAGKKPVTTEQVILMLCDSIEAASRTLKEYSSAAFSEFVENIVRSKQDQIDESDISIRDLGIVKNVLKNYLGQMYHERIAYPASRRNNQNR